MYVHYLGRKWDTNLSWDKISSTLYGLQAKYTIANGMLEQSKRWS